MNLVSSLVSGIIVFAGLTGLWIATNGFQVFTTETARRLSVLKSPRQLPPVVLENQDRQRFMLGDLNSKAIVLVDFIYTRCAIICQDMGSTFQRLQNRIVSRGLGNSVKLLSISFDYDHDMPQELQAYLKRFAAQRTYWQGTRVVRRDTLEQLLRLFEITIIPDRYGGYTHNSAIYMIADGYLVGIFNIEAVDQIMSNLESRLVIKEKQQAAACNLGHNSAC